MALFSPAGWSEGTQNSNCEPESGLHLLQTPAWGEFKRSFGWTPVRFQSVEAKAQVLFRSLPLGLSIAYLPKGPCGLNWGQLWTQIDVECRRRRSIFLQVEPDFFEPTPPDFDPAWMNGFTIDEHTLQPRRTILIDLRPDEETLLTQMKQKTRYNIRLAEKKGVVVSPSQDLEGFYALMQRTGSRDGFAVHSFSYYQRAFELFAPSGQCVLLRASFQQQSLAFLMLFILGQRSWYFYGASEDENRSLMPTYLLQWEAMRYARSHGATSYDLWGIPDADVEALEDNFANRSDGLWGVYRFKRGFGGKVVRTSPAYLRVYQPLFYQAYRRLRGRQAGGDAPA